MRFTFLKPRWSFTAWLKAGVYFILIVSLVFAFVGWQFVRPASGGDNLIPLVIVDGLTASQVSSQLKQGGLINSSFWFEVWLWLSARETKIVSGSYYIPANVNIINLAYLITGGVQVSSEVTVRLVEGWTIKQMADYFESQGLFSADDFINAAEGTAAIAAVKGKASSDLLNSLSVVSLEGYLFPDTYRVYNYISAEDMVVKMVDNLDKKFSNEWRKIAIDGGYSIHQVLTLASIVEKEVSGSEDRKIVADIFWKRLNANIGLQADSTVNYVTGKSSPAVSSADLLVDSPYNTYKYRGLPPGPISNPALSAIEATIFPEANDYWYFLTTPQGEVIYSKTFEQHRQAKLRYLQ